MRCVLIRWRTLTNPTSSSVPIERRAESMTTERYDSTIVELGQLLRQRETTSTELTRMYLERLDTIGRRYNAVVSLTDERALREAAQADAELAAGYDRGPLHGIPYGAKDLLNVVGYPTSWGAVPYK